ncbi:M15 family metallopeptidase [Mycobacterium avium subsp. paratuberculosis]|uniref:M15 family metallopeptidase n=2 Tax=Mycobacterium avium TaxID=1764 RepID=UPI000213AB3B|nr:M15 family metallopeptidase [Mycobacterium avium]AZP80141.1 M15 family peptidase [Mycobacterium avium subsp. paratuberculosis]QPM70191.1 M15 family metallopeptidase [Mycobacterium avium subsp. paratuberculosis S397]WPS77126.1 M15 family metallopeptidase [Mycobacterium avium subsp. paratuberculosis]
MGAAAQGGNKRAGAPSLLPGGRWAAVLAGAVMLAQCTASSAAADPTVRPVTAAELGASWHPGCPVEPGQLRRVDVDHIGFDGQTHRGELIVHQDLAPQVVTIFARLYRLSFPIEKIRTVDHYRDADDELSMEDDNTSAFNCRGIPGSDRWSEHAYGRAIDLNPRLNPCLYPTGAFQPQNAGDFLDRDRTDPGLLHDGDPAVRAFTDSGWRWGGQWTAPVDYQHFERP